MDLNVDNYEIQELLQIFDINLNNVNEEINIKLLENKLNNKINNLKNIDNDSLTNQNIDNKTELIDFFYKCFIKLSNQIKNKQANNVIAQDNHFIISHNENKKPELYQTSYKSGIINPLTIKTLKKIININTRFRDNYNSTSSTDFIVNLPYTLRKVLTMKLLNYRLPNTNYTVSDKLSSNYFTIKYNNDLSSQLITLSNGSYDDVTIENTINEKLNYYNTGVSIKYNEITGTLNFTSDNSFTLDFDFIPGYCNFTPPSNININQLTLGWLLGFRGNYNDKKLKKTNNFSNKYQGKTNYEGESLYDNLGNTYFLLCINDFKNNHDNMFISPFINQSLGDNNILAKLSKSCSECQNVEYPKRIYFGPTDINKLHVKIYDEYGRIIDINNADLYIELEFEILYDL